MRKLKPVHISILTIVVFVAALLIGMQSDWWILEGRKTPLDGVTADNKAIEETIEHVEDDHDHEEDDHEMTEVSGGTTVQDAIDIGIPLEDIERILESEIDDKNALIKDLVTERGLKFGQVKDSLNALIK